MEWLSLVTVLEWLLSFYKLMVSGRTLCCKVQYQIGICSTEEQEETGNPHHEHIAVKQTTRWSDMKI